MHVECGMHLLLAVAAALRQASCFLHSATIQKFNATSQVPSAWRPQWRSDKAVAIGRLGSGARTSEEESLPMLTLNDAG